MKKRNILTLAFLFSSLICIIAQDTIVPADVNNQNNTAESSFRLNPGKYYSLGIGAGTPYGGYGLKVQYKTSNKLGLAYHFGVGTTFENDINASAGIKYYFYKWLYLNPQFGYFMYKNEGLDNNQSYYTELAADVYGAFYIGGDIFFTRHFGLDFGIGAVIFEDYVGPTVGIGLQYKF
ncbi:MAG: hypothetical protein P1P88_23190 [Bacteroidales bacterium]|nr:hypothetical protein [Bacteroidales bacterium]